MEAGGTSPLTLQHTTSQPQIIFFMIFFILFSILFSIIFFFKILIYDTVFMILFYGNFLWYFFMIVFFMIFCYYTFITFFRVKTTEFFRQNLGVWLECDIWSVIKVVLTKIFYKKAAEYGSTHIPNHHHVACFHHHVSRTIFQNKIFHSLYE